MAGASGASGGTYGYRRITARADAGSEPGGRVGEWTVRSIMGEEGLVARVARRRRRHGSYGGEISEAPPNLLRDERGRHDFGADAPNEKWVTDVTEFRIPAGKACLSPIVDCFDGMPLSWSISTSPDAEMANSSLLGACEWLREGDRPTVHSDRGGHYRWPGRVGICEADGLAGSMSRKGARPRRREVRGLLRPPRDRALLRVRSGRGCNRRARENARRVPEVARGRRDQERPRSWEPDAAREGFGVGSTDVGQLTGYPEDYDEDEEAGAGVRFGEAGESRASTFDVTLLSRGEVGGGDESPWPTIGASVGLGTTAGAELDPLAGHARGIDRRLGHHGGGARSAPRARDLDHTPCHAAGSACVQQALATGIPSPTDRSSRLRRPPLHASPTMIDPVGRTGSPRLPREGKT